MDDLFLRLQTALAGEYSIERELGRGGMGVVYLARDVRLAREVAIKLLPPELASARLMREQFLREAQMAARLSHPNIVPIHRVDEADGLVYFVMGYVSGDTLAERVRTHGPLPPHHAARVLRELAWALTYAHSNGIVHRDVKPENVLLERGGDRAIVTDFGIASATSTEAQPSGFRPAGSPHYASPEQIAGEPVGPSSDIYSLGVTGFVMLTGRLPFDAPTVREVLAMHLTARPPSITALAPNVPARLAHVVDRCLAKRPEHRPASAAALTEALDAAIEPPREVPAPLRVWLNKTNQFDRPRVEVFAALLVAAATGAPVAFASRSALAGVAACLTSLLGIGALPSVLRMRELLGAGYDLEDLRSALRDYWVQRREELLYELTGSSNRRRLSVWFPPLSGAAVTALLSALAFGTYDARPLLSVFAGLSGAFTFGAAVLSLNDWSRLKQIPKLGADQIKFYDGKWGERFVRLCGFGLKRGPRQSTLPQLTEVALGRATDALYDALPKPMRKQLKALPDTVRRLEEDAKRLRAEIDKLDASISELDGDARAVVPTSGADSPRESDLRAQRDRLRAELRALRERATDRLAATVAALENIRLDLLRLQLGGDVVSVTASLDAAQHVAADIQAFADAQGAVDRLLRDRTTPPAATRE